MGSTAITDRGVATLASALRNGQLGSSLRGLYIGDPSGLFDPIGREGAWTLREAIVAGEEFVARLQHLYFVAQGMTVMDTVGLCTR